MWRAVTWPVRSRPVRRMLLLRLGMEVRRRLRSSGAVLWSDQQEDDRRSRWPWVLALTVAGLAAGLVHRRSRQRRSAADGPPPSAAPVRGRADRRPGAGARHYDAAARRRGCVEGARAA